MDFKKFDEIGPNVAVGKFFKLMFMLNAENLRDNTKSFIIPAGCIGFCYACDQGSLYLGFADNLKEMPRGYRHNPERYKYATNILLTHSFRLLEIQS